ncbi:MAG: hypothetical protein IKQ88_00805 [Lachnospiraceae bacterium]|nr:hypothetical protein [Lachnospiraceae bacterium]
MRKRILNYLAFIDGILSHDIPLTASFSEDGDHPDRLVKDTIPTRKDYEALLKTHLDQIAFFQHERMVHLIVTFLFALLAFLAFFSLFFSTFIMGEFNTGLLLLFLALMVLLIPYIWHYYLLENSVQKMYRQYDEIMKMIRT